MKLRAIGLLFLSAAVVTACSPQTDLMDGFLDYRKPAQPTKAKVANTEDREVIQTERARPRINGLLFLPRSMKWTTAEERAVLRQWRDHKPVSTVELLGQRKSTSFRVRAIRIKVRNPLPRRKIELPSESKDRYDPQERQVLSRLRSIDNTRPPVRLEIGIHGELFYRSSRSSSSSSSRRSSGPPQLPSSRGSLSTGGSISESSAPRWVVYYKTLISKKALLQDGTWQTFVLPRPVDIPTKLSYLAKRFYKPHNHFVRVIYGAAGKVSESLGPRVIFPDKRNDPSLLSLEDVHLFRIR